jgi:hypothetical protein
LAGVFKGGHNGFLGYEPWKKNRRAQRAPAWKKKGGKAMKSETKCTGKCGQCLVAMYWHMRVPDEPCRKTFGEGMRFSVNRERAEIFERLVFAFILHWSGVEILPGQWIMNGFCGPAAIRGLDFKGQVELARVMANADVESLLAAAREWEKKPLRKIGA